MWIITRKQRQARIDLPANTGSWQVANYQEAERGSFVFFNNQEQRAQLKSQFEHQRRRLRSSGVVRAPS